MLSPYFGVVFQHVGQSTNSFANSLADQGVDKSLPFAAYARSLLSFPFDDVGSFFILLGKGRMLLYILFSLP